jgi:hypothetical protein
MKQLVFSLLCFLSISAAAANRYINSAASGSSTGVDWTNAWPNWSSIKWASINPGDTVYVAGGVYSGQLTIGRSGTVRSPITIERVRSTDAAATAAAGWNPSFDSQVVQNAPRGNTGIYINQGIGSFVTIDGRRDAGWRINISDASTGVEIDQAAASNVTLRYIQVNGPGMIVESGDVRGFNLTPKTGRMSNLTVSHCEVLNGCDAAMYLTRADNAVIEYCSFHGQDSKNPAQFHTNVIYCGVITNSTFRYNRLYDIQVEGLFFNDPDNKNIRIYRNLFYQGSVPKNSGRALQFTSSGNTNILVYNNTFVDLPVGIQLGRPGSYTACEFKNNIVFGCSLNLGPGWVSDYNLFSDPTSEPHSIRNAPNPFRNSASFDYHLKPGSPAIDKGLALGPPYDVDPDGNARTPGRGGAIGAY